MIKYIFILLFANINFFGTTSERKELIPNNYVIINSDSVNESIPSGKARIKGQVFLEKQNVKNFSVFDTLFSGKSLLFNIDGQNWQKIDSNGSFDFIIDTSARYLSFYTIDSDGILTYEQIYLENYKFHNQHLIDLTVRLPLHRENIEIMVDKPVLCVYSKEKRDVSIRLKIKGELHFSYPELQQENECYQWKMNVKENDFTNQKGQSFPYLFWDSKQKVVNYISRNNQFSGKILFKQEIVPYLDSVCDFMNFEMKEKTDFITYWGPRLIEKEFCFIQFQTQEECDQFAEYEIEPKPEFFNRFYILFSSLDVFPKEIKVIEQKLTPFQKGNYSFLEWGGANLPLIPEKLISNKY